MELLKDKENKPRIPPCTSKIPILRGKINLFFFLLFPVIIYWFMSYDLDIDTTAFLIFTCCASFSFGSSITLHIRIWDKQLYSLLRKIDYACIFLMIGGCGIPTYAALMKRDYIVVLTVVHWILLFTGVFSSLLYNFGETTKMVRSVVYLSVSTPYIFVLPTLFSLGKYRSIIYLGIGGLFYSIGSLVYGSRFPNLIPGVFEYHELFHIFSILGYIFVSIGNFFMCKR